MEEKKLSILGLRGAGKSTFMAVLNTALSDQDYPSKWVIMAYDDDTNRQIFAFENLMYNAGLYPDATIEKGLLQFTAQKSAELGGLIAGGNFKIIAGDVPGEAVKGQVSSDSRFLDFYKEYVAGSSAVIFLLDPHEVWRIGEEEANVDRYNYFPLIRSILTEVKQQVPNVYIAFGVTKVDDLPTTVLSEDVRKNLQKQIYSQDEKTAILLAETILGKQAMNWIDQNFSQKNLSWWLISATGFLNENGNLITQSVLKETPMGQRYGIKDPSKMKPIGVVEIVEWALDRIARNAESSRPSMFGKIGKWIEDRF